MFDVKSLFLLTFAACTYPTGTFWAIDHNGSKPSNYYHQVIVFIYLLNIMGNVRMVDLNVS